MGKAQSSQQQSINIKINHPKLQQTTLLKQDNMMRTKIEIQNQSDFLQWQKRLNKVIKVDDQVLLLPKAYQYTRKAICGSAGVLQIDYDFYQYLLSDQLKNRRKCKRYFQQPQVWYLLYSLVTAAHDFSNLNEKIGDVRPQNIFINEDGHIKVSNLYSWPSQTTNFQKTQRGSQRTYLSPQQLQSIREGKTQSYIDKLSSQSFSIGLTLLQSAMLQNISNLFLSDKKFDIERLQNILRQWWNLVYKQLDQQNNIFKHKQYSNALKLTLVGLCQINPKNRLTSEQVYQWLKPFHQQINFLSRFQPNMPPVNINSQSLQLNPYNLKNNIKIQGNQRIQFSNQQLNSFPINTVNYLNPSHEKVSNWHANKNFGNPITSNMNRQQKKLSGENFFNGNMRNNLISQQIVRSQQSFI